MAHFARLDSNSKVTDTYVVDNNWVLDGDGKESEAVGIKYLQDLYKTTDTFVQYSMTTRIRVIIPGIGDTYNASKDRFEAPKPSQFPSWVQNSSTGIWEEPIARPPVTSKNENWGWVEETQSYVDCNPANNPSPEE